MKSVKNADGTFVSGARFQDFAGAPEMIIVPPGTFLMGSPQSVPRLNEHPQHLVNLVKPFAVGVGPVTLSQFAAFVQSTNYRVEPGATVLDGLTWRLDMTKTWREPGFVQAADHPVVCVSWIDAQAYIAWLRDQSGRDVRLLSEAEWEYCCRAGTTTAYNTGDTITAQQANFSRNIGGTTPVFSYAPNGLGLYDMHGNVWEWCEDNWHEDYNDNPPSDGAAWPGGDPSKRVLRGSSWIGYPDYLRSAYRDGDPILFRDKDIGFRIAASL